MNKAKKIRKNGHELAKTKLYLCRTTTRFNFGCLELKRATQINSHFYAIVLYLLPLQMSVWIGWMCLTVIAMVGVVLNWVVVVSVTIFASVVPIVSLLLVFRALLIFFVVVFVVVIVGKRSCRSSNNMWSFLSPISFHIAYFAHLFLPLSPFLCMRFK